jgi:hypothetical protein
MAGQAGLPVINADSSSAKAETWRQEIDMEPVGVFSTLPAQAELG